MPRTVRKGAAPDEGRSRRDAKINLRLSHQTRDLIDAAASAEGKSRTEFVIETARRHAIDVLLDQRFFELDAEQSAAFLETLANPPEPNEKLRALMNRQPPWRE